jgi:cytochrome oxidase assembly protein ShyY1
MLWPDLGLIPLAGRDPWSSVWPKRVQRLNVARMASQLENVVAREVRLEAGQPGVLAAPGLNVAVQPAKHTGYAVQWFALAGVLALGYVAYGSKNREKRADESTDSSRAAP